MDQFLGSTPLQGGARRSAVQFNTGSSIGMNVDVLMYGGGEALQDYWALYNNLDRLAYQSWYCRASRYSHQCPPLTLLTLNFSVL